MTERRHVDKRTGVVIDNPAVRPFAEKVYATDDMPPGLTAWIESIPRLRPEDTT